MNGSLALGLVAGVMGLALAACSPPGFHCDSATHTCNAGETCTSAGWCAQTASDCATLLKYTGTAGDGLANQCVPGSADVVVIDVGTDAVAAETAVDVPTFDRTCARGATELCNGFDDNCNGRVDEGCPDETMPLGSSVSPDLGYLPMQYGNPVLCTGGLVMTGMHATGACGLHGTQTVCTPLTITHTVGPDGTYQYALSMPSPPQTATWNGVGICDDTVLPSSGACSGLSAVVGISRQNGAVTPMDTRIVNIECAPLNLTGPPWVVTPSATMNLTMVSVLAPASTTVCGVTGSSAMHSCMGGTVGVAVQEPTTCPPTDVGIVCASLTVPLLR